MNIQHRDAETQRLPEKAGADAVFQVLPSTSVPQCLRVKNDDFSLPDAELTGKIIGAAIEVHKVLGGPGLLESVYEEALCHELSLRRINFKRQVDCPVVYKGATLATSLRIDLLVEDRLIIECKATLENNPVFAAQCLTYLRLSNLKLGLVINFGGKYIKDGIERVIN